MIKVKRVDHVGIAVKEIAEVLPIYRLLGLTVSEREDLPDRGIKLAFLPAGESQVELLEGTGPDNTVAKFLEKRGEGIHHLCLAVEDLQGAIKELSEAGFQMIDKAPRPGGQGHMVAFVHPSSTHGLLLELLAD